MDTNGLLDGKITSDRTVKDAEQKTKEVSEKMSKKIKGAIPKGEAQWNDYDKKSKK